MNIQQQKVILRKKIKDSIVKYRKDIDLCFDEEKRLCQLLFDSPIYKASSLIFAYLATKSEISLDKIIKKTLQEGKILAVPKCNPIDFSMDFFQLSSNVFLEEQLISGNYGIREPVPSLPCIKEFNNKTLILLPGIAFTRKGHRLGQGKGFYDRYLARILNQTNREKLTLMGVCHPIQLIEEIPIENTDILVDYILTPVKIFSCIK